MAKTGKCENYRPPRACHVGEGDWRSCATWGTSFTVRTSRTGSGCALRFGGSLPTSFTGRASRPGSDAPCVAQRGRCPDGLGKPRPFAHGDGLHGGTEPECNHHEYALEFFAILSHPTHLTTGNRQPDWWAVARFAILSHPTCLGCQGIRLLARGIVEIMGVLSNCLSR